MNKKNVLVVEDNELNREMLADILSSEYHVYKASNGQEAIDILKTYHKIISIILLDIMMPVMDGYTFLKIIKNDSKLSLIPVIVTTHSDNIDEEIQALTLGATDFVPKPYKPQVIKHRIASLIKLRETSSIVIQLQYDKLTGAYSKEYFYEKVRQKINENPNHNYSIIASNIENFKFYNEAFGVIQGDELLKQISSIFLRNIGDHGFVGRFEADKFLCFVENLDYSILEKIKPFVTPKSKTILMRYGIYSVIDLSVPVEQMCDRALLVANSIKGQYGKYYAIYDDTIRNRIIRINSITEMMEQAIKNHEFTIYLQPKIDINNNKMVGAEALVRWINPTLGFLSPGEFIPIFEKNGFIFDLNKYVWEEVCKILNKWKGEQKPLIPVSVNVSRSDIPRTDLGELFFGLIKKYNLDTKILHLEITESAYANNPKDIVEAMKQLRHLGFEIEMDDFGSGYSSLNLLSQMKVDILKLDMKFIQNETQKSEEESILFDVIRMAHRMKIKVVAEGVETDYQIERLKKVECDYVQGYYYSKPIPVDEFEKNFLNRLEKKT